MLRVKNNVNLRRMRASLFILAAVAMVWAHAVFAQTADPAAAAAPAAAPAAADSSGAGGLCPAGGGVSGATSPSGVYFNGSGGGTNQCVALTDALEAQAGGSTSGAAGWKSSGGVSCSTPAGTPVATFLGPGGTYGFPGCTTGCQGAGTTHTGIFEGCDSSGNMLLLNQWAGSTGSAHISSYAPGNCGSESCMGSYGVIAGYNNVGNAGLAQVGVTPNSSGTAGSGASAAACTPAQTPAQTAAQQAAAAQNGGMGVLDPAEVANLVYQKLSTKDNCWGCQLYAKVVQGINAIASQSFQYVNGGSSDYTTNAGSFIKLSGLWVAIVMLWKLARIVGSPLLFNIVVGEQSFEEIIGILTRYTVILVVFFGATSLTDLASTSTSFGTETSWNRTLFIDGPFAIGAQGGCKMGELATAALGAGSFSCSDSGGSWVTNHVNAANTILLGLHQIGSAGISLGIYISTKVAMAVVNPGLIQIMTLGSDKSQVLLCVLAIFAGIVMTISMVAFTVTFALRYVDAALRAAVAIAFMPIFLILWVFNSTRPAAIAAFKAVLFMMALFTVAGIAYAACAFLILHTIQVVNPGATGSALDGSDSLAKAILALQKGILNGGSSPSSGFGGLMTSLLGANNTATVPEMNWGMFLYILAGLTMAMATSMMPFALADGLIAFAADSHHMSLSNAADSADASVRDWAAQGGDKVVDTGGNMTKFGAGAAFSGVKGLGGRFFGR